MDPLICIEGSASPGHSYPMTPLNLVNMGKSPVEITYSANPAAALAWLHAPSVEIPAGGSASIPLTLVVPADAGSGENYVILNAGGVQFDVRFSVSAPAPAQCVTAGYNHPSGTSVPTLLWLILIIAVIIAVVVRVRSK